MAEKVVSQVTFELGQIDQLLVAYAALWDQAQRGDTPDLVEMTAMASVLHSFYNGLENIFVSIAKGLDQQVPTGVQKLAEDAELNATTLYRTLSSKGNPALKSLTALLRAMGLQLAVRPLPEKRLT